ncbi:MAG: chromosome partitioning protein ParA [Bacteroidetes bacterium]|jgi:uncharacterized protein YoxC|nr:chromosome partitioning protein ParA [Bacteroidota bacterium]
MSEHTAHLVARLRARLERTARRMTLARLLTGLLLSLALAAAGWGVATAVEALFWLGPTARALLFWSVVLSVGGAAAVLFGRPALQYVGLLRAPDAQAVAHRVGNAYPAIADRLTNLLQLADGARTQAPNPLVDGAVRDLAVEVDDVPFEAVEDFSTPRRVSPYAALPVVALLAFALLAPASFFGAAERLVAYDAAFERPAPFSLEVRPLGAELIRGDSLAVTTRAYGDTPGEVTLRMAYADGATPEDVSVEATADGVYPHTVRNIREPFRYQVSAGPVTTDWYNVTLVERPRVRMLNLTLTYPSYTGRSPEALPANTGDVRALPGTEVALEATVGGSDVAEAYLLFEDGTQQALTITEEGVAGAFTLTEDGSYQLMLQSPDLVMNRDPITHTLRLRPDAPPRVDLLAPAEDIDLPRDATLELLGRIQDDYGFSVPFTWSLTDDTTLDPGPGDVIEYYLQIRDNDTVTGPKASRSAVHRVRVPSLAERYERLDEVKDDTESRLEETLQQAESLRQEYEEFRDEMRRSQEADWQDEQQLERMRQQQEQMEQQAEQVAEQMEALGEEMRTNDLVSDETSALWEELQEVTREINSPELQQALEELREAMQEMDMNRMQEAFEDYEFNEDQYRDRLERTLDLFRNLRVQQELEEAANRFEDLAEQQEQLEEETGKHTGETPADDATTPEDLAAAQDQAAEEMRQLEEQLDKIREQMEEVKNAPSDALDELREELQDPSFSDQLQENAEQLRQEQMPDAQQGQQQMQQQMRQKQEQLMDMQQQMQGAQMQVNLQGLRQAISDVLTLSQRQESLRHTVRDLQSASAQLRTLAQQQSGLTESVRTVSDSLQTLAREIPQMGRAVQQHAGDAMQDMERATASLSERETREAQGRQRTSMMHLNELALVLSELYEALQDGDGSGSGMSMEQMMEQLQQMTGEQQQLNEQIQQMLNETQGERLNVDQQQRLNELSQQQERIREQLREMNRDRRFRNRTLGDLEDVANQMQRSIEEMEQRRFNRELPERQDQILTRLLEATRALNREGEKEERRGTTGEQFVRDSPEDLSPEQEADRLRQALLQALERGYASDYEQLIRRYFELLQETEE